MKRLLLLAVVGCGSSRAEAPTVQVQLSTVCKLTSEFLTRQDGMRKEIAYTAQHANDTLRETDTVAWYAADEKIRSQIRGLNEMRQTSSSVIAALAGSDLRLSTLGNKAISVMGALVVPGLRQPYQLASLEEVFSKLHAQEMALETECQRVLATVE